MNWNVDPYCEEEHKSYLWVGQAAHQLGMSSQTVRRLFDEGVLTGYVMPTSRHRRISTVSVEDLKLNLEQRPGTEPLSLPTE